MTNLRAFTFNNDDSAVRYDTERFLGERMSLTSSYLVIITGFRNSIILDM